jgi:hypothetical protein
MERQKPGAWLVASCIMALTAFWASNPRMPLAQPSARSEKAWLPIMQLRWPGLAQDGSQPL